MANHYLGMIADALMEFDGVDINDAQLRSLYKALAWDGLKVTQPYQILAQYEIESIENLKNGLLIGRAKCQ